MKWFSALLVSAVLSVLVFMPAAVFAGTERPTFESPLTGKAKVISLAESVGLVVSGLLGFAGVLAVVFILVGGIRIIGAAGNEDKIKQGKETLLWAVLGLIVAFGGYVVVNAVVENADKFFGA